MVSSKMSGLMTVMLMIVVATTTTIKVAEGQASCVADLVPCANYINSTNPPPSCCDPLRKAITTELDCLCKLYENPAVLAAYKININQALKLPSYCNIPGDLSACKASAPGSSSQPPPATPGGNGGNGVGKIAGTGLSSFLLLLVSLMLC